MTPVDLVIRNGLLIDGTGTARRRADVGIAADRIVVVGEINGRAREIDATNRIIAPGFIDAHTHDDRALLSMPDLTAKVSQGVTTVVAGNCGVSLAPLLLDGVPPPPLDLLGSEAGWFRFDSFGAFVHALGKRPPAVNCPPRRPHHPAPSRDGPPRSGGDRRGGRRDDAASRSSHGGRRDRPLHGARLSERGGGADRGDPVAGGRGQAPQRPVLRAPPQLLRRPRHGDRRGLDDRARHRSPGHALASPVHRRRQLRQGAGDARPDRPGAPRPGDRARRLSVQCELEDARSRARHAGGPHHGDVVHALSRLRRSDAGRHRRRVAVQRPGGRGAPPARRRHLLPARRGGRPRDPCLRAHHDRVGRPAARPPPAPAALGHVPPRARPLQSRPRPVPARGGGPADDEPAGQVVRVRRPGRRPAGAFADLVVFDAATVRDTGTFSEPAQPAAGIDLVMVNGRVVWHAGRHTGARPGRVLRRERA